MYWLKASVQYWVGMVRTGILILFIISGENTHYFTIKYDISSGAKLLNAFVVGRLKRLFQYNTHSWESLNMPVLQYYSSNRISTFFVVICRKGQLNVSKILNSESKVQEDLKQTDLMKVNACVWWNKQLLI